jgi:hypothetical protein
MMLLLVLTGLYSLCVGACFDAVLMANLVVPKFDGLLLGHKRVVLPQSGPFAPSSS